eukprot:gene3000-3458_t
MTHIFEWKCSYYCNRTWKYGKLKLYQQILKFKENAKDGKLVLININDITEIKRRTTNLLFNAITVLNRNNDLFWFSSFANVYNVLSIIEHFWRDNLFGSDKSQQSSRNPGKTSTRNELLEIAYDSQSTLMSAGRALHAQGEQITEACKKMDMLHSDLRVGEKIVSDLDSWFGSWNVKDPSPVSIATRHESPLSAQRLEYAVLIAKMAQESHSPAVLVIGTQSVEIFGDKNKLLYCFPIAELSHANVHSPYDMTFEKRLIGKPDIRVHIVSTRLPFILKTFENSCKYKPIYEDLPTSSDDEETMAKNSSNDYCANTARHNPKPLENTFNQQLCTGTKAKPQNEAWIQNKATSQQMTASTSTKKQFSDSDANELAAVIRNMKSMAVDINKEQELQNDQIGQLTQSVQKADTKIRQDNRIIKKML